ncbi:hypothetical protein BJX70DRAFT_402410 [Aspergillus crustosus]
MLASIVSVSLALLATANAALHVVPADAPDGFQLHVRNADGTIHSKHISEFAEHELENLTPESVEDFFNNTITTLTKRDGSPRLSMESTGNYVNVFEICQGILQFEDWLGKGRKFTQGWGPYTGDGVCYYNVAATWKVDNTIVYICSYKNSQYIDVGLFMDQVAPLLSNDFQGNAGNEDSVKAAYATRDDWKAAFGWTNVGTRFCQMDDWNPCHADDGF